MTSLKRPLSEMVEPSNSKKSALENGNNSNLSYNFGEIAKEYVTEIKKFLEIWIPRKFNSESLERFLGKYRYRADIEAINKVIAEPIWELLDRGGKRWRSVLLLLIAETFGKKKEHVMDFVTMTEIVHNGSLIIDDIEDDSECRRGKPCLHKMEQYGLDVAINVGNFMYFLPLKVLSEKRKDLSPAKLLNCYEVYSSEMLNLHLGQGLDICWHSKKLQDKEPSIDEYLLMCANKTGGLARMCAKLSAILCDATPEQVEIVGKFAESIGIAFQIIDDIMNVEPGKLSDSKGMIGEDIHEGKRSIMVIHCLDKASEVDANRLKEILALKTTDQELIKEAISIMVKTGSIDYAKKKAEQLINEAWEEVSAILPDSPAKLKLRALVDFLLDRDI